MHIYIHTRIYTIEYVYIASESPTLLKKIPFTILLTSHIFFYFAKLNSKLN